MRRRDWLIRGVGAAATLAAGRARAEAVLGDDGLYHQPWFLDSFLILPEDHAEAHAEGRRFAVMWELKGCPYCRDTHLVNFAVPEIERYVRDRFAILQLNIQGARRVTDYDGEELEERALAAKYGIRFTPTVQFFPPDPDEIAGRAGKEIEVARMPGYLKPDHFLAMFRFVEQEAYRSASFQEFLAAGTG